MARPLRIFRRYPPAPARAATPTQPRRVPYLAVGALVCSAALGGRVPDAAAAPLAPAWTAAAQAPVAETRRFDIDAGPLPEVLAAFEAATGVQIVVDGEQVRATQSPGVHGVMTPNDALAELLMGTALRFRFSGPAVVTIDVEVSEFVAVRGELPRPASPKFTEPLLDTPQTITVIPGAVIEAQGASTLRDVLRNVPGITYQAGEGGGGLPGDKLTMRGFRAENDIFVDGVRDVGAYTRDAFNLEQVEVVKGPASTFGGRGTTGGAINLATKAPGPSEARSATVGLGNADYRRGTVDLNQPLDGVAGAAVRLNAMWTDTGVPGRDVVHNEGWAVAPSVAFGLGGPTRVTFATQHTRQDNVPDYGLPWAALDAEPGVDQGNFYGLRNYDYEDIASDMATARIEHEVTQATLLRNVSRWGRTVRDHAITAPRPPNRQLQQRHLENDLLTNQTSLTARLPGHTVSAGVEFVREGSATWNQAQTGNQPQVDLYAPDPSTLPFGPLPENLGNPNEATTTTLGAYLFETVPLGDHVEATGGLRWDRAHVDYTSTNRAEGTSTAIEKTESVVSWRAGLVYKPRPNGSLYAGVGTSFDPGYDAGNTGTGLSEDPASANYVNLDPERTINYELGTKWDLA
ncbi:MAG: TonB-dependent receptor, partial [Vicinamibacterales bacterium]